MNVLVTGASGFLGSTLCRILHDKKYTVSALSLDASTSPSLKDLAISKIDCDVTKKQDLTKHFENQDVVFHLASIISILKDTNKQMYHVNVDGVRNVAEAALAASVKRFIHVSSIHSFHRYPQEEMINEDRRLALTKHEFDYDRTKALGELAFLEVVAKGLNGIIVSPTCFIGPNDYEPSLMGNTLNKFFVQNFTPVVKGGFNFLDVRDAAHTLINGIHLGDKGARFIIAGEWISISEMVNMIFKLRQIQGTQLSIPNMLLYIQAYIQMYYSVIFKRNIPFSNQSLGHLKFHRLVDDSKARKILNHKTRPLMNTLKDTYSWINYRNSKLPKKRYTTQL